MDAQAKLKDGNGWYTVGAQIRRGEEGCGGWGKDSKVPCCLSVVTRTPHTLTLDWIP